jgi:hypothetical protein
MQIKIIAATFESPVIERILTHLGAASPGSTADSGP